tara:strand:- start:3457 stop:4803 length:1347 start_codon:yes stop_codon:yes gene_type:complete
MSAQDPSIYEFFTITSNEDPSLVVELKGGTVSFSYFENVLSPMVTAQAIIATTGHAITDKDGDLTSIYNGLPLRGGEMVEIKIASNRDGMKDLEFTKKNGNELYVGSVTNIIIDKEKETFTLNLISKEAITNETTRVGKKFGRKISESVQDIIENYLKTDKKLDFDETENDYSFIGNMKKPFTILTWLASKSVPSEVAGQSSSAGYFFFETKEGYHFRSVDSLIASEPFGGEQKISYVFSPGVVNNEDPMKDFKVLDFAIDKNENLIKKLERGGFCSFRTYFNPLSHQFTKSNKGLFKLSDYAENMENLGEQLEIKLRPLDPKSDKTLADLPTRYVTGTLDFGTLEKKGSRSRKKNAEPMDIVSQAMMRYNTLFTVQTAVTVPLNVDLCAGSVIHLTFNKVTPSGKNKVIDEQQSGLYMIKELVHYYESKGSFTRMKLVRDTHGPKAK